MVWMHQKDLDSYVLFGQTYIYYVIWCFQVFLWLGLLVKLVRNVLRASPKTIYEKIGKKKKKQELLCRRCLVGDFEFCFYNAAGIWVFLSVFHVCGWLISEVWFWGFLFSMLDFLFCSGLPSCWNHAGRDYLFSGLVFVGTCTLLCSGMRLWFKIFRLFYYDKYVLYFLSI